MANAKFGLCKFVVVRVLLKARGAQRARVMNTISPNLPRYTFSGRIPAHTSMDRWCSNALRQRSNNVTRLLAEGDGFKAWRHLHDACTHPAVTRSYLGDNGQVSACDAAHERMREELTPQFQGVDVRAPYSSAGA
jgi:hypothetical protein